MQSKESRIADQRRGVVNLVVVQLLDSPVAHDLQQASRLQGVEQAVALPDSARLAFAIDDVAVAPDAYERALDPALSMALASAPGAAGAAVAGAPGVEGAAGAAGASGRSSVTGAAGSPVSVTGGGASGC